MAKVGWYTIGKSTTLESNKSQGYLQNSQPLRSLSISNTGTAANKRGHWLRATAHAEERAHVRGEACARLVTDIEHMPAGIELELRTFWRRDGRQVLEHIPAGHVRGHQIGIAVGNDQPEGRVEREENPEVVADARLPAAPVAPVPVAARVARHEHIGQVGAEPQFVVCVADEGASIGAREAVEHRIGP